MAINLSMPEIRNFLPYLQEQFKELEALLTKILKEEKSLRDEVMVEKGFIIHSYSLNYSNINLETLAKIVTELENVLEKEIQLQEELEKHADELQNFEQDYRAVYKSKLEISLLAKFLKEALYYCKLMIIRAKQLQVLLKEGMKIHKKSLPKETEIFFASFENIGNKIMRFILILEQLTKKINNYAAAAYYGEYRKYGRAMASSEYQKTVAAGTLSSSKDPTPVFDATRAVIAQIKTMSKDKRKDFFGKIGVVGGFNVVFFQTKLKPINHDQPIPQTNGLREYKFPRGIKVEILEAA